MVLSVYQTLNFQLILNPEHVIQNLKKYSLIIQVLNLFLKIISLSIINLETIKSLYDY
jgi:hypothetical protein